MQHPFLNDVVDQACTEGQLSYCDTLARMQQCGAPSVEELFTRSERLRAIFGEFWGVARKLAQLGQVDEGASLMASCLLVWSVDRALTDAIAARRKGRYLDPADQDVVNDAQQAIEHKAAYLAVHLYSEQP